jgi:acetolactate synthase I/II/III large subunit
MVTDVGQHQMVAWRYFKFKQSRSVVTSGGLGTMGFGLPAAIGAKLGRPDRDVVLFVGDGGFQMTIQELGTIYQSKVPVKIVLLNNNFLGMVRQWQELFFELRYASTELINPDFQTISKGYYIPSVKVTDRKDLDDAVRQMASSEGPFLLEVVVEKEGNVFPMVTAGASVSDIRLE